MKSWCAETLVEPVPDELAAILQRLDNDGKSAFIS
jgi:hypothetical protein